MNNEISQIAQLAVETFGEKRQMIKAIEELGELQSAISRYLNNDSEEYRDNLKFQVIDEIVDVYILTKQLMIIFPETESHLNIKTNKLMNHIYSYKK